MVELKDNWSSYNEDISKRLQRINPRIVGKVISCLDRAREEERTIYFLGNGGSATLASHFAADLSKNTFKKGDRRRFRTIALTDSIAWITSVGNDISYDDIFIEQLKVLLKKDDVVFAISASGNSMNVVKAVRYSNKIGATTIGLLGFDGGKLKKLVIYPLIVSSNNYGVVESIHSILQHFIISNFKARD